MTIERPMFPPAREIIDTIDSGIQDTFCETLVRVEHIGACRRLVLTVTDNSDPKRPVRVVTGKLLLLADALPGIAAMLLAHGPADSAQILAAAEREGATAH